MKDSLLQVARIRGLLRAYVAGRAAIVYNFPYICYYM